ncbi:MAG: diguanylate cyclase [Thermoleophilia bacterium]|nr:diguanylate cyclase [Thermoleophilia bacterium]
MTGDSSPGSQLFIYRLLHLAINQESPDGSVMPSSYLAAKNLARQLEITGAGELKALFRDLGLGELQIDITRDRISVSMTAKSPAFRGADETGAPLELERGLVDGALEIITGLSVETLENTGRLSDEDARCFEAVREVIGGQQRFIASLATNPGGFTGLGTSKTGILEGFAEGNGLGQKSLKSWFMDLAMREVARARRHGRQLTVMYVDLDDLGQINTAHGRAAGDRVIRAVGTALSKSCRSEDFLWHQGEDEFAILLSETDADGASIVASRLSTEVLSAAEYIDIAAKVSASIGFSTFPVNADSVPGLFDSARSAVYLAKSLGKGRAQRARSSTGMNSEDSDKDVSGLDEGLRDSTAGSGSGASRRSSGLSSDTDTKESRPSEIVELQAASRSAPVASVIIASSSPLLIAGMRQVLIDSDSFQIVAEILDNRKLLSEIADQRPDLIFADLEMSRTDDFAVMKLLRGHNLPCKYAVFSSEVDQDVIKLAADYSIDGVILQESASEDVIAALQAVFRGKTVLPVAVADAMKELTKNRRLLEELSEREIEVLRLIAEGKSNSQISNELFITVNTVRFHLANIYQKLSVSNRTEAANYYLRQDLAPDGQTRLL